MPKLSSSVSRAAFEHHCNAHKQLTNTLYLELLKDASVLSLQPSMRPALDLSFAVGVSTQTAKLHRRLTLQGFRLALTNFKSRFDPKTAEQVDLALHAYINAMQIDPTPVLLQADACLDKNLPTTIVDDDSASTSSSSSIASKPVPCDDDGTADALPAVFQRLLSPATFTGTHRARFDKQGHGRGAAGRDSVAKGTGSVALTYRGGPNASLASITNRCPADIRGVPLGASKH